MAVFLHNIYFIASNSFCGISLVGNFNQRVFVSVDVLLMRAVHSHHFGRGDNLRFVATSAFSHFHRRVNGHIMPTTTAFINRTSDAVKIVVTKASFKLNN